MGVFEYILSHWWVFFHMLCQLKRKIIFGFSSVAVDGNIAVFICSLAEIALAFTSVHTWLYIC